ncbi:MAG: site-2 protease family protein [Candidatus Omnitrophota bacterium]
MRGTFRLVRVFGIDIDIHFTFFLLLGFFFWMMGTRGLELILGVFLLVTIHELCHSLAAAYFGIKVRHITLLPMGGVASMPAFPVKPYQELLISLAGPVSNLVIILVFYYPLCLFLGKETLMYPFFVLTGQIREIGQFHVIAHIYWINLILAVFNMIPAFPMDGGRVLRAVLSYPLGHRKATAIAVALGRIFALIFAYFGIARGHILLLVIAVFIYTSASNEVLQIKYLENASKRREKEL